MLFEHHLINTKKTETLICGERARSNISKLTNMLALTHAEHVPSTYALLLIKLTYMLLIMFGPSFP